MAIGASPPMANIFTNWKIVNCKDSLIDDRKQQIIVLMPMFTQKQSQIAKMTKSEDRPESL